MKSGVSSFKQLNLKSTELQGFATIFPRCDAGQLGLHFSPSENTLRNYSPAQLLVACLSRHVAGPTTPARRRLGRRKFS